MSNSPSTLSPFHSPGAFFSGPASSHRHNRSTGLPHQLPASPFVDLPANPYDLLHGGPPAVAAAHAAQHAAGAPLLQQHNMHGAAVARAAGSRPDAGGSAERLPSDDPIYPNAVKISHSSKIPAVAGKVAHSVRAGDWPTLLVAGNGSIHAAVKCCITAGRFLQPEGHLLEFETTFREADHSRTLLALRVLPPLPPPLSTAPAALPPFEIKVSTHSRHAKVGAALSARLSEGPPRPVALLALGETAVANAVMAAAHAAHYLAARDGARVAVHANTAVVVKDGSHLSGVALTVRLQQPAAAAGAGAAAPAAAPGAAVAGPSGVAGGSVSDLLMR